MNKYIIPFLFAGLLILSSCRTVEYVEVPVETVKTEYKTNTVHDSVFVETIQGSSVINEK